MPMTLNYLELEIRRLDALLELYEAAVDSYSFDEIYCKREQLKRKLKENGQTKEGHRKVYGNAEAGDAVHGANARDP